MEPKTTLLSLEKKALERVRRDYYREAIDDLVAAEVRRYVHANKQRIQREVAKLFDAELKQQLPKLVKITAKKVRFYVED